MHTKKLFSPLSKMVPWLVIFATVFITIFGANVSSVAAFPAAAPDVGTLTVDAQVGTLTAGTGGTATFLVTVTSASTQTYSADLSATGLPAGVTASFSPATVSMVGGIAGETQTASLTVTADGTQTYGNTSFTVKAVKVVTGSSTFIDDATGTGTLAIQGVDQTITFGPLADMTVGDPDFTVSASASSGLPVSYSATGDCTVTGDLVHLTLLGSASLPGSCTITASQAGDSIYNPAPDVAQTFAIKFNQSITFNPIADMAFGDLDFTAVATATSGLTVTFTAANNCTVTGDLVHLTGAGTCELTASQPGDAAAYNAAPDVVQTFAITKGNQSITFDPIPDKTYADLDFTVTATATSALPVSFAATGDCVITGTLVHLVPGGGSSLIPGGSCTITASQPGDVNYNAALDVAQTFAITKANQTITFNPLPDKYFGELDFTVVATATSGLTVTYTAANDCSVTGDLVHLTGIGSCTIGASQAGDIIYNAAPTISQTFAINPSQTDLSVSKTVDNPTPFDGDTVVFTIAVSNLGPENTIGITATDLLPAGLSYVSDDSSGSYNSLTGEWSIASLNAGISTTLKITATVDANTDGDIITNTATVASTAIDIDPLNNSADAVIHVRINDLCATTGSVILPDATLPIWGYAPGDCTRGLPAQLPGPSLVANMGETVNITLHNGLTEPTSLLFKGLELVPDLTGVAPGGAKLYTFTATRPGTYLYEAGPLANAQHQILMGMYGGLIIRPANAGQAYNDPATAFNDEALLVLSDIDPALNNSANPAAFDIREYSPKYYLINGNVYPNTSPIPTVAGNQVLLRYINAGIKPYTMALLGVHQTAIAMDGNPYAHTRFAVAETLAPGQTADTIVSIPAAALDGTKYPLYNSNMFFHNNTTSTSAGFGGMLTFLTVTGNVASGDTVGPQVSTLTATGLSVNASLSDAGRGDSAVTAAEYFVDTTAANGTGTAMAVTGGAGFSATASGSFTPALLGVHTVYVHGQDAVGNWGPFRSVMLTADTVGPDVSAFSLSHNPNNGAPGAVLRGTADDRATGGSSIAAAEYTIDGGTAVPITVSPSGAIIAGLSATIPPATLSTLVDGVHVVSIRSQDSQGNWGPSGTIDLNIDRVGPSTSNVTASPSSTNGTQGVNASVAAVRITATFADANSNIVAGEAFIDTVGADGTGIIFLPSDGINNELTEVGYGDIPLTTIVSLTDGNHVIYVHGKDEAGNWGATSTTVIFLDKTAPTVIGVSATPNPTGGAASVALTASASEAATSVVAAEWFVDVDPGPGNGTPMTISGAGPWNLSATVNVSTWANGNYTLYVRAQDAAGNWSMVANTVLVVDTPPPPVTVPTLNFSTLGSTPLIPGMPGTADNSDIYNWDGTNYSHQVSAAAVGMPGFPNVDGLVFNSPTDFYISLTGNWNIPGVGIARDEDVIHYSAGTWSIFVDLTPHGMTRAAQDLDAIDIVGGVLYFSTRGNRNPPGVTGTPDNADIYSWDGTNFARVFDATANGLPANTNVDGLTFIDSTHFYLSFSRGNTNIVGLGKVQDEDVVYYNAGNWSVYFDGTANFLGGDGRKDIDAISIP